MFHPNIAWAVQFNYGSYAINAQLCKLPTVKCNTSRTDRTKNLLLVCALE